MAKGKDYKSEEEAWAEYLSSIEKPGKPEKKGFSIGERLKSLLESIGIDREKKTGFEGVKEQVAISAEEGREKAAAEGGKNPAVERRFGKWAARKKETVSEVEAAKEFPERKELPGSMEKYLEKIEEKEMAGKKEREFEALSEKKAAEEEKKKLAAEKKALEQGKKLAPEEEKQAKPFIPKKILLLPARKEFSEKKVAMMPKAAAEEKGAENKIWVPEKGAAQALVKKEKIGDAEEKIIAEFVKPKPSLAKKSVEEIKRLSPKQIKKEVAQGAIEGRAVGWYGDVLKHKKAAVSGWRLRKKVRLHQLKKKEKQESLTENEKNTMKELVSEDRALRGKIGQIDQQIRSLQRIAGEKKKENLELEEKIRAIGVALPEKKTGLAVEGGEKQLKKGEMVQLVETMKKIADEMAATSARESMAGLESEEAMPIEDRIKAQENMIKNLERAFYKRKVDFDQFREKMFDYQSKLTEMKIRKKINEERMENISPEMKRAMEKRIAAGEVGKGVGIPSKTAEALERIAEGKTREKEIGAEAVEAIKRIAEKQAAHAEKETEETRVAEKTASILERIAERLGNISRGGASQQPDMAEARETTAGQRPSQAAMPASQGGTGQRAQPAQQAYQGGTGQQANAYGKETQSRQAQPGLEKEPVAQGTQAQPGKNQGKGYSGQQETAAAGAQAQSPGYQGQAYSGQSRQPPYAGQQYQQPVYTGPRYQGPVYQQQFNAPKGRAVKGEGKAGKKASQQAYAGQQPAYTGPQYQEPAYTGPQYRGRAYWEAPQPPEREAGGMPRPAADFYEEPEKQKKGFFGRLKGRVSEKPASRQPVGEEVDRAIREKAAHSGVSKEQIDRIEKKLGELLEKYKIPEAAVADRIRAFDEGRLIEDFQKLMSLIEEKKENSAAEFIRPAPGFDISSGIISRKKEKIEGMEKEIKSTMIETSFDRVLALVQVKGAISLNDAAIQLGMGKEEVQQCAEILERSRLINLSYPPIGPVKLIYPAYLKWKAEEKKKEAEEKKQKKEKKVVGNG